MTRRSVRALLVSLLIGGYTGWCISIGLLIISIAIIPLQKPPLFYSTLTILTGIAAARIFYVQMKKPSL